MRPIFHQKEEDIDKWAPSSNSMLHTLDRRKYSTNPTPSSIYRRQNSTSNSPTQKFQRNIRGIPSKINIYQSKSPP